MTCGCVNVCVGVCVSVGECGCDVCARSNDVDFEEFATVIHTHTHHTHTHTHHTHTRTRAHTHRSNDVDFEEFATVMLSSRKGRRHNLNPAQLSEKLCM